VIAVVCAVPAERRALAGLASPDVTVRVSGIGAAAAERAAADLPNGLRAIVAAGFCGALDAGLRVGDLIVAEEVVDEASGDRYRADAALLRAAPGRRGTMVSAVRLARTPADRRRLDGTAVDMESAALARAAAGSGTPFLALRAVTDETRHRLPDLDKVMDAAGRLTPGAGMAHFVLHPRELPALARLGPASRTAGRSLRAGLQGLIEAIR
jgi:adenosylhomocysteine nucleosidase